MPHPHAAVSHLPLLAKSPVPTQAETMEILGRLYAETGSLPAVLQELERWSRDAGYFAHLTEPNAYLSFPDQKLGVVLRLQINYSRLSYTKNPAPRAVACHLCYENIASPGKELLRAFEFTAAGAPYFAHLTPFPLHEGHFVMNSRTHAPMHIDAAAIEQAADFARRARGWLAASNSDVEWAGASILGHHHCQIFRNSTLPIEDAARTASKEINGVRTSALRWPGPTLRLEGAHEAVVALATVITANWKALAPGKNTVNFLARAYSEDGLTIHIIFRDPDHRTVAPVTALKSEGVGIIEVAGEIIVPPLADKTREENVAFFRQNGLKLCLDIITMNTPAPEEWPTERLLGLAETY
ncbi:hypothetical protein BH09SUM1_BH09SUM1_03550 [soil metagenome]